MKSRLLSFVLAAAFLAPAPAFAKKIEDVKKDGYKCERAGVDSIVCTKKDAKDYTCDNAGTCEQLRVMDPGTGGGKKPLHSREVVAPKVKTLAQ